MKPSYHAVRITMFTALLGLLLGMQAAATEPPAPGPNFWGLNWVWPIEGRRTQINAQPGNVYLRRVVFLEKTDWHRAEMQLAADNGCELFVNGQSVASIGSPGQEAEAWRLIHRMDIRPFLQRGENLFAIRAWNGGHGPNPAGICGRIVLQGDSEATETRIPIDISWESTTREMPDWNTALATSGLWYAPTIMRFVGANPWGMIGGTEPIMPDAFPNFIVPGHAAEMGLVRAFFFKHFPANPAQGTMWDFWSALAQLWPATGPSGSGNQARLLLENLYRNRRIDSEGYVTCNQHLGLAHHEGWPFPLWTQGGGMGWHFSLYGLPYGSELNLFVQAPDGWTSSGIATADLIENVGLPLQIEKDIALLQSPEFLIPSRVAPYFRCDWRALAVPEEARCSMEWTTEANPEFSPDRRIYFNFPENRQPMDVTMIPLWRHPEWGKAITGIRFRFENARGAQLRVRSIVSAIDSRHNINNTTHVKACVEYLKWTGDLPFARDMLLQLRRALRYAIDEFEVEKRLHVWTPWPGHDGKKGFYYDEEGNRVTWPGWGIGSNYFDILPFGGHDMVATIYLIHALESLADLEEMTLEHPGWNLPHGGAALEPAYLRDLARRMRAHSREYFWLEDKGRFFGARDVNGEAYDFGFVVQNLEAVFYGLASDTQAREIMDWISGRRIVEGDTSQGADIYHWRFAPRCTTKRNLDYYSYVWPFAEHYAFGDQVQDGGAVLGFSYFDLMARLEVYGPDNAWQRLSEILRWFEEVQAEGGYRAYYAQDGRGTLQGGGQEGGLGIDQEFFESMLVPQVLVYGFMGFEPRMDGFVIQPRLPSDWPSLRITSFWVHGLSGEIAAGKNWIELKIESGLPRQEKIFLAPGTWRLGEREWQIQDAEGFVELTLSPEKTYLFERTSD